MLPNLRHFDETLPLDNDNECFKQAAKLLKEIMPHWENSAVDYLFFTNGIMNKIFCCKERALNEKVIFRIYGRKTELLVDRKEELKNWQRLTKSGCAAPLYATFNNGIICGYQPGETLNTSSVKDPVIAKEIARALATMHRIATNDGEKQSAPCYFRKLREYLHIMPPKFDDPTKQKKFEEQFPSREQLLVELSILEKTIEADSSTVVFCHNDLLLFNILFDKDTGAVNFIDYEYADFNYQAYDIGNHFCEYAGVENPDFDLYPSREYQLVWLTNYLQCYLGRSPTEQEVDRLYIQVNVCAAAAHLFWSVWSVVQAHHSTIDFDFLDYAISKNSAYQNLKRQISICDH